MGSGAQLNISNIQKSIDINGRISSMPSFHRATLVIYGDHLEEVAKFRVEAKPLGFRGIPGLSWLLHLTPYITGCKPKFRIHVTRLASLMTGSFQLYLRRIGGGKDYILLQTGTIKTPDYNEPFQHDEPISTRAEFSYILQILAEPKGIYAEVELVSFRTKYQEDVTMWIGGFILGLFGALLGALLTWLLTRGH